MNAMTDPVRDRPWLNSYPEGVPAEIDPDAYQSLKDILNQACETYRDKPAFTCMGKTLSFAQLDAMALQLAAYLQSELKLTRGDRVAIMMPNILQYPVAIYMWL
jgi:long-chain acyl-CoA synthetase